MRVLLTCIGLACTVALLTISYAEKQQQSALEELSNYQLKPQPVAFTVGASAAPPVIQIPHRRTKSDQVFGHSPGIVRGTRETPLRFEKLPNGHVLTLYCGASYNNSRQQVGGQMMLVRACTVIGI